MASYGLQTPQKTALILAQKTRVLRLQKNWTQKTFSERSGVSLSSVRRFEQTGQISLNSLLLLVSALGRLQDFSDLLSAPKVKSIKELEEREQPKRQRGRV